MARTKTIDSPKQETREAEEGGGNVAVLEEATSESQGVAEPDPDSDMDNLEAEYNEICDELEQAKVDQRQWGKIITDPLLSTFLDDFEFEAEDIHAQMLSPDVPNSKLPIMRAEVLARHTLVSRLRSKEPDGDGRVSELTSKKRTFEKDNAMFVDGYKERRQAKKTNNSK
jgi:hypothetical protein